MIAKTKSLKLLYEVYHITSLMAFAPLLLWIGLLNPWGEIWPLVWFSLVFFFYSLVRGFRTQMLRSGLSKAREKVLFKRYGPHRLSGVFVALFAVFVAYGLFLLGLIEKSQIFGWLIVTYMILTFAGIRLYLFNLKKMI